MSLFHLFNYSTSTVDIKQVSSIYNVIGVSLELLHRFLYENEDVPVQGRAAKVFLI